MQFDERNPMVPKSSGGQKIKILSLRSKFGIFKEVRQWAYLMQFDERNPTVPKSSGGQKIKMLPEVKI